MKLSIRNKLILVFLAIGILPAAASLANLVKETSRLLLDVNYQSQPRASAAI